MKWHERDTKDPDGAKHERAETIGINNLLLRGSNLRNTEWVLGVVVFTGAQTKIMLNSGITPSKRARMAPRAFEPTSCEKLIVLQVLHKIEERKAHSYDEEGNSFQQLSQSAALERTVPPIVPSASRGCTERWLLLGRRLQRSLPRRLSQPSIRE